MNRHQIELKKLFCDFRNVHVHTQKNINPDNLFVGVGSDEEVIRIDILLGVDVDVAEEYQS